jgi:hypothetical protein
MPLLSPRLNRLHHWSGTVIAAFLLLHAGNHLFALGGPDAHIRVMGLLRKVYRFPPVEALLLLCVLGQILTGLLLVRQKGFRGGSRYDVLQTVSGLYLSFFLIYHVRAVLVGRWMHQAETDFYFAAGVANQYPEKLFFIPYYTLSLLGSFVHLACVHRQIKLARLQPASPETPAAARRIHRHTLWIMSGGAVITTLIMLSFTGVLYPIP